MSANPTIQSCSLADDQRDLRRGDLALRQAIGRVQARFEDVNGVIQAFLPEPERFERLRRQAEQLAERHPDSGNRPALFGALLGVKDIFHVDGFVTRAGASLPPALFAGAQAAIVSRLLDAGALMLGKTVTTEFAYFEPGPTRNPHDIERTPGGSSSGSAASVASGLTQVALGTQTVGSVIRPAAYCGVVGFKPSFERVPTAGTVRFSSSADHVGFFTQDAADMRMVAGAAISDWRTNPPAQGKPALGIPDGSYLRQCGALDEFEAQIERLAGAGYRVRRIRALDDIDAIGALHQDMIAAELAREHHGFFARHEDDYRQRTADLIRRGQAVSSTRLAEARQHRLLLRDRLHRLMDAHEIDVWVCPSAPAEAPQGIGATGDPMMNMPWTHAGLPALSLPAGPGRLGLPLGLQLVARYGQDEALLQDALDIERCLKT